MLSFMTLSLESLHSTVNTKMVEWAAYYFTSRETWYRLPENTMKLEELKFPKREKSYPQKKK